MTRPTVCYYVSGHGLGHASRAAQVMAKLDARIRILVKSAAPAEFFRQAAGRPLEVIADRFDIGVVQPDNRTLDWQQTFCDAALLWEQKYAALQDEVKFLQQQGACAVISDVPPMPLLAARRAGIPAVLVANFTWLDIYKSAAHTYPDGLALLRHYADAYACADITLRPGLAFGMRYQSPQLDVGLIARRGQRIRKQLEAKLGVSSRGKMVLLYFGNLGDQDLRLRDMAGGPNVTFVSFTPLPGIAHELDPDEWHFPDVVASVDAVLAKPGYGTVGECMANGTPVIYYPRPEFAEYRVLRKGLQDWGGAVQISTRDFITGNWSRALESAWKLKPDRVPAPGASRVVSEIEKLLKY
ncbi:MAG: hypothetical protein ACR2IE_14730 [Candidatus Sumerlaeaceae bacterium]